MEQAPGLMKLAGAFRPLPPSLRIRCTKCAARMDEGRQSQEADVANTKDVLTVRGRLWFTHGELCSHATTRTESSRTWKQKQISAKPQCGRCSLTHTHSCREKKQGILTDPAWLGTQFQNLGEKQRGKKKRKKM